MCITCRKVKAGLEKIPYLNHTRKTEWLNLSAFYFLAPVVLLREREIPLWLFYNAGSMTVKTETSLCLSSGDTAVQSGDCLDSQQQHMYGT